MFSQLPLIEVSSRYSIRKFPLHILTILSGHSDETSQYCQDSKNKEYMSYVVWQYTLSGKGRINLNDTCYDLFPGSLMIVSVPGSHIYYLPEDSAHWEFVFLAMVGREAVRITKMIEQHLGNIIDAIRIPKTLTVLYEFLENILSEKINNPFINSKYSYLLCMTLMEEIGTTHQAEGTKSFEKLILFLKKNIQRDISVKEMAEVMQLSSFHFTRLFRKEMGLSPRKYLEDLRLRIAMDILFEDKVTIKEIAARCGIYDVNYFCHLFKKYYGLSPKKYKVREGI
jgi:AraC-like DNA-binding protein